ncbi:hypothetical protein PCC7418_0036 [Halothece sp. PCC 7418]|uniref:hypothetical protein n=1 Tax=Halothece sp. (strain PCC 7418) TaxID=65093 RepID=UPI0002A06437|nr:hypothetical protein [Halothece sp. PCC 7418]AFZ42292.1 hypothetical protein PCC7418_0036 [Halothece sp. PCC 7418]
MTPNPLITNSIEKLDYRVTVGDVAAETGLKLQDAQQGLVALAADAGGHLQVSETGDITYLFPENFRGILRNKYLRLRLKEWWDKIWGVLFYLIRISFGIILIASIVLIAITISLIVIGVQMNSDEGDSDEGIGGGGGFSFGFFPFWFGPDLFWFFSPGYYEYDEPIERRERKGNRKQKSELSFLEAIFSFLFGDGNPNAKLEERRWQEIGSVIRQNRGAVVGEQIAPYLDEIDTTSWEDEDYMLSVLTRFNGIPEVTEDGQIIYYFPDLQVTATGNNKAPVPSYLEERKWQFTKASSTQKIIAIGLGGVNLILALMLGSLLSGEIAAQMGGLVAFVNGIYGILLAYAIGYLTIPLIRYFWIQQKNQRISARNEERFQRVRLLASPDQDLQNKLQEAKAFASQTVLSEEDIAYSTEQDLMEQEAERSDKIDEDWERRLNSDQ